MEEIKPVAIDCLNISLNIEKHHYQLHHLAFSKFKDYATRCCSINSSHMILVIFWKLCAIKILMQGSMSMGFQLDPPLQK